MFKPITEMRFCIITFFILIHRIAFTQSFEVLLNKAWSKDQNLKSKEFKLQSAEYALKQAKALYYPTASFGTQYSLAAGGRSIAFPIGDLLNPVYNTLNNLTNTNNFGTLENQKVTFLPNNFYDAKFRIQQPIYYPDLSINKSLKQESLKLQELEIKAYKRYLSKEVMNTYFQTLMTNEVIDVYNQAHILLIEAKRSTTSMLNNGIAIPSALSRIESQIADINAKKIDAVNNNKNAKEYLYFLTNDTSYVERNIDYNELPTLNFSDANIREELLQIEQGNKLLSLAVDKEKQFYLPKIGAQLDLGSQAFNFGFEPYVLLGINLDLDLYDHGRHNHKLQEAKANLLSQQSQYNHVYNQIELQSKISLNNLVSAIEQAITYKSRIDASKKIYKEVFIKYKEGTSNYIELLDAQTQLTNTEIQYQISKLNAWLKWSEHLYNTASIHIP
jgi:outer membrane protein TolC